MTTREELEIRVRASGELADRLKECARRIGLMCSEGRGPRMSVPSTTLQDALIDVRRLDSRMIETTDRDEFGEEQRCICAGVNLRRSIDAAVLYTTPNVKRKVK